MDISCCGEHELLDWYDGPMAYGIFLLGGDVVYVHCADSRDADNKARNMLYFGARMTMQAYDALKRNEISIYHAAMGASRFYLQWTDEIDAKEVPISEIEEFLPEPDVFLNPPDCKDESPSGTV